MSKLWNPLVRRRIHTGVWSTEQWRDHLLEQATTEREREEIQAIFNRY